MILKDKNLIKVFMKSEPPGFFSEVLLWDKCGQYLLNGIGRYYKMSVDTKIRRGYYG